MGSNAKVINLTSGNRIKRSQAKRRVEQCLSEWVDDGFTIRDLSASERVSARSRVAKDEITHNPLPFAEWPGLVFRPSDRTQATHRAETRLMQIANQNYICECSRCMQARELELKRAKAEAVRFMAVAV